MSDTIPPEVTGSIRLRVRRGGGPARDGQGSVGENGVSEYQVPAEQAGSLLDGLRWVRTHLDESLAFRYACINANACKECMLRLDGKTVYACTAKLAPGGSYEVGPLPNKPLVRDLVTEIAPSRERLFAGEESDGD